MEVVDEDGHGWLSAEFAVGSGVIVCVEVGGEGLAAFEVGVVGTFVGPSAEQCVVDR